nr:TraK family protein [uncultured Desulfovibrio sp.]
MARVEFFAVRQEVEELLAQGHTLRLAYEHLFKLKKISMAYDSFRRHVKGAPKKAMPDKRPDLPAPDVPPVPAKAEPVPHIPVRHEAKLHVVSEATDQGNTVDHAPLPSTRPNGPRRIGATFGIDAWRKKDIPSAADLTIKPIPESSPESGEA